MRCIKCETEKEESEYRTGRHTCKQCEKEYCKLYFKNNIEKERARQRKYNKKYKQQTASRKAQRKALAREFVEGIKSGKPCADCGRVYPNVVMDFDHICGEKIYAVSFMVNCGLTLEYIKKEIDKCELVCHNCHRIRTLARKGRGQYHTTSLAHVIDKIKSSPCADCGLMYPLECMDFDHLDPLRKSFGIGPMRIQSLPQLDKLMDEIAKCELVCANCHRVRTHDIAKVDS